MLAAQAHANDLPSNTLIRLQSSVFDMRVDAAKIRRADHFIPITRVDWINNLKNADPHLDPTVIHIQDRQTEYGELARHADLRDTHYSDKDGLPEKFLLDGYDERWQSMKTSRVSGGIMYFPEEDPFSFNVSCSYDSREEWTKFCAVIVSYPPDPLIQIMVRVYFPTRPLNDFRAIAHKARTLVYCYLDVTDAVKAGTWEKTEPIQSPDEDFEIEECREFTS